MGVLLFSATWCFHYSIVFSRLSSLLFRFSLITLFLRIKLSFGWTSLKVVEKCLVALMYQSRWGITILEPIRKGMEDESHFSLACRSRHLAAVYLGHVRR